MLHHIIQPLMIPSSRVHVGKPGTGTAGSPFAGRYCNLEGIRNFPLPTGALVGHHHGVLSNRQGNLGMISLNGRSIDQNDIPRIGRRHRKVKYPGVGWSRHLILRDLPVEIQVQVAGEGGSPRADFTHVPQLGAIEGIGGADAQSTVRLSKYPETMIVWIPKPIGSNGLKIRSVTGDIAVKAPDRILEIVSAGENSLGCLQKILHRWTCRLGPIRLTRFPREAGRQLGIGVGVKEPYQAFHSGILLARSQGLRPRFLVLEL